MGTIMMFQSPRSGKFVSNITMSNFIEETLEFQSPRSGKFVSNIAEDKNPLVEQYLVSIP